MTVTKAWIAGKLYGNITDFGVQGDNQKPSLSTELNPDVDRWLSHSVALNCSAALRRQPESGKQGPPPRGRQPPNTPRIDTPTDE